MTREQDEKKFNRLMVSAEDFDEARNYLEAIEENTPINLRYAGVLASLIAYCRSFQKSKKGKREKSNPCIKLNPEAVLSQSEALLHKQLIVWRNNAAAHSGFSYRPAKVMQQSETSYSFKSTPCSHYLDQIDPTSLARMAEKFRQAVLIEANELKKNIGDIDV